MNKDTTGIMESLAILNTMQDGTSDFSSHLSETDKPKEYQRAWQQIVALGEKFKETEADKKNISKAAYGIRTSFNMRKINGLLRQLSVWIDAFIINKGFTDSGYEDLKRAIHYLKKGEETGVDLPDEAIKKAEKVEKAEKYFIRQQAYLLKYLYPKKEDSESDIQAFLSDFKAASTNLFFYSRFKANIEQLTYLKSRDEEIPQALEQEFFHLFALLPKQQTPTLSLLVLASKLLLAPNLTAYECFKNAFACQVKSMDEDKGYFLTVLLNSLILFPFLKKKSVKERLALYEIALDNRIFHEEGRMRMNHFNNIAYDLHLAGNAKLLEKLISRLKMLIKDEKQRKNCIAFADCYVRCAKGLFDEALDMLKNVHPLYPKFKLRMYLLEFICKYEMAKTRLDAFLAIKESEERYKRLLSYYLVNKKVTQIEKRGYLNFYKLLIAIANSKLSKTELLEMLALMKDVVVEEEWLEKKIAELAK